MVHRRSAAQLNWVPEQVDTLRFEIDIFTQHEATVKREWCLAKAKVGKWGVRKVKWEPAAFHHWYDRLSRQKRKCVWDDLKREYQKLYIEWKTFRAFAQASGLDIDPRSVETCDPNAAAPPLPDVRCLVSGQPQYFELGEVTDESVARAASIAAKNRQSVCGGFMSQRNPLVRIFLKKCRNRYTANGRPLHLVLHFAVGHQSPFSPELNDDVAKWRDRLIQRIRRSQFDSVWLYDGWQKQVLARLER